MNANPILNEIVDSRTSSTKPEWFSDLFLRLMWVVDQEKIPVVDTFQTWIENADDKFKVQIALTNDEVFLYQTWQETDKILQSIREKWPTLIILCNKMVEQQKLQEA